MFSNKPTSVPDFFFARDDVGDGIEEKLIRRTIKCEDENCMVTFHPMCAMLVGGNAVSASLKKETAGAHMLASKKKSEHRREIQAKHDKRRANNQTSADLDEEEDLLESLGLGCCPATYQKRRAADLKAASQFTCFLATAKNGEVVPVGYCPVHNPYRGESQEFDIQEFDINLKWIGTFDTSTPPK